jgi:hypothetical protein
MRAFWFAILTLSSISAFAIPCDCEVKVFSPSTASHQLTPNTLTSYQQEDFATYSSKAQLGCRASCLKKFQDDLPTQRLHALLITYSIRLIEDKAVGFNCTGLTTLKYPVRVKATLGDRSIGNVVDEVHVINHEEVCF